MVANIVTSHKASIVWFALLSCSPYHVVLGHWNQIGNWCLITGIPYKEGVYPLSLDRKTDDLHHTPDNCLLVGTYLNNGKERHKAFKTTDELTAYCREHGIDE